ncbi:NAD-dependent epimerase/dehydratase family protein [Patescibacteria group bacterium]|nr:NAD-dependent epimerase/dehydratase family protein [Patescibacteria group bacterium]
MKILITGGAGFIGSNLAIKLYNLGYEIIIVDNLSTGFLNNLENIKNNIIFENEDIINREKIFKIFEKYKPEYVFHLAAQSSVSFSIKNPDLDMKINYEGSKNIIDASTFFNVKKIIYSGSGGTYYGDYYKYKNIINNSRFNLEKLAPKEFNKKNPISPYGISKAKVLELLKNQNKLNWIALMYGNVYGPMQNPYGEAGVISIFSKKMLLNKKPIIYGDGECIRDYIFVEDVVSANIKAQEKGNNEIINIANNKGYSTLEIYKMLKNLINYKGEFIKKPYRDGDVLVSILNIEKAKNILNFEPKYNIKNGLIKTIEYLKDN